MVDLRGVGFSFLGKRPRVIGQFVLKTPDNIFRHPVTPGHVDSDDDTRKG